MDRFRSHVFFFSGTATTEIYTLSLHDALPICAMAELADSEPPWLASSLRTPPLIVVANQGGDRKSTRLNSSHANISYAVFCLKKKRREDPATEAPWANSRARPVSQPRTVT